MDKSELKAYRRAMRSEVELKDVTILSNTCLGGKLYNDYSAKFLSPTIDLYIPPKDFVKFVDDLDGYLNEKLYLIEKKVAKNFIPTQLGDINIYFTHSNKDFQTSVYNWDKRRERIVRSNIRCICTDRNTVYCPLQNCGYEVIKEYGKIDYNKVFFTTNDYTEFAYVSYLRSFKSEICCPEATRPSLNVMGKYIVETDGFDLDMFINDKKI